MTEHGLVIEALGGDVVSVEMSALEGTGIDELLEYIDLIAEVEDFTSNPGADPFGTVIESQLDKGRGPVATVIVQRGTLRPGDALVAGSVSGRVRAMFDENGQQVKEAGPSTPVLIMGWDEVPDAGDRFEVAEDHRTARTGRRPQGRGSGQGLRGADRRRPVCRCSSTICAPRATPSCGSSSRRMPTVRWRPSGTPSPRSGATTPGSS